MDLQYDYLGCGNHVAADGPDAPWYGDPSWIEDYISETQPRYKFPDGSTLELVEGDCPTITGGEFSTAGLLRDFSESNEWSNEHLQKVIESNPKSVRL